jgi:GntR family transcriptional regulator / MocR family aminotransferase
MGEPIDLGPLFPDRDSGEPLGQQLVRRLRDAIEAEVFKPGSRLLPSRELASRLGMARNTVTFALEQLVAEGYLEARIGSGTFIARTITRPPPEQRTRRYASPPNAARVDALWTGLDFYSGRLGSLRMGSPDPSIFPLAIWETLERRNLRDFRHHLDYGTALGSPVLRDAIAQHVRQFRGIAARPENVMVVDGTQCALATIGTVLGAPGENVLVEDPGYPWAVRLFELLRLIVTPIEVDDCGVRVDLMPAGGLAYVTPSNQFPLSGAMSRERRSELLAWAVQNDAYVIEDDYDGEYAFGAKPLPALHALDRDERVIYLGTFSKTLAPGLRLSYMILPDHLVPAFSKARPLLSLGGPTLVQSTMAAFITEGHFARYIRKSTAIFESRRAALIDALKETALDKLFRQSEARTGLHLSLRARERFDDVAVSLALMNEVTVHPLSSCCLKRTDCEGFVLGYSAAGEESIRAAVLRLAEVVMSG